MACSPFAVFLSTPGERLRTAKNIFNIFLLCESLTVVNQWMSRTLTEGSQEFPKLQNSRTPELQISKLLLEVTSPSDLRTRPYHPRAPWSPSTPRPAFGSWPETHQDPWPSVHLMLKTWMHTSDLTKERPTDPTLQWSPWLLSARSKPMKQEESQREWSENIGVQLQ